MKALTQCCGRTIDRPLAVMMLSCRRARTRVITAAPASDPMIVP